MLPLQLLLLRLILICHYKPQIANGFVLANKAIDSGAALSVVKKWGELTNEIVSAR